MSKAARLLKIKYSSWQSHCKSHFTSLAWHIILLPSFCLAVTMDHFYIFGLKLCKPSFWNAERKHLALKNATDCSSASSIRAYILSTYSQTMNLEKGTLQLEQTLNYIVWGEASKLLVLVKSKRRKKQAHADYQRTHKVSIMFGKALSKRKCWMVRYFQVFQKFHSSISHTMN